MKKISIIGSGGSGKSTLAKSLEAKLGIEAYHLDSLFWKPGWVETGRDEWRSIQESLCAKSEWILDGNYGGTIDVRLKNSDTIIFLDINRYTCLFRAIWRSIKSYGKTRPDMAEGCKEQFDFGFAKWILDYPNSRKPKMLELLHALPNDKKVIILRSPREVKRFLENA
ncbi:DNA topology modulation protein [Marinomonas sp. BSi20584]|jgi:adenylate kinase family enzyme|uniref:DNA topology modulation protein n=1 Tax=Marinomonas sp. BSi20584 TaxID=1594462 RepID=UPI000C1EBD39|nr:DNA topology modulation protein [Marinomonas sp. BSi20584]PJE57249.1 hypothetical protein TY87_00860 [Marinomonas sp. BSi20584]